MLLETVGDLLLDQLRDLYSIETQTEVALPVMVEQASSPALKAALEARFEETETNIERLQEIFGSLGVSARGPRCLGIAGLLQETDDTVRLAQTGPILDAAIVACFQRIVHYQIATYRSARAYAMSLGETRIVELLAESIAEQTGAESTLSGIGEGELAEQAQAEVLSN